MIYLDSAATTFQKPAAVHRAVAQAMRTMSSPGRGGYESARLAEETLFPLPQRGGGALFRALGRAGRFHDERGARAEYRCQEPCPAGRPRHRVGL